ncbi:MAG: TonB-dependent receptor [Bacteroidota bacterium]
MKYTIPFILVLTLFFSQSMEAFPVEWRMAGIPADSVILLLPTPVDTILQFNQIGSYGLFINGIKTNVQTNKYNLFGSYSYRNFNGYRVHGNDYGHTLNLMVETAPSTNTTLQVSGNYFNGVEKRPGSLTKSEFEENPFLADPRAVNRDEKRIVAKGRLDLYYSACFGKSLNQKIEISGTGKIENLTRSTKDYKIISKYGLGLNIAYTMTSHLWERDNELSLGGNIYKQPEREEEYENRGGQKSDQLEQIMHANTNSSGCFITDNFELVRKKLFLEVSARYDNVTYHVSEETVPSRSDKKRYHAVSPYIGLNYKITSNINLFTSYGFSFKSPEDRELESVYPSYLYNQDLMAQLSKTFDAGINVDLVKRNAAVFFRKFQLNARFFQCGIEHEIVPYEIYGDEYYRNATKTNRLGFEVGSQLEIVTDLTLSMSWSYAHFIYSNYKANSLETDSAGNIVAIYRDFAGNAEPNIPRNNLNLSLSYKHPLGEKTGIFAQVAYQYLSGLWVDDANSDQTNLANLVNTALGVDLKFGHFRLSAYAGVNNIFNQIYVGYTNTNSADKHFYNAGAPRNFTGSVNWGFVF